jgi:hypothetical protein
VAARPAEHARLWTYSMRMKFQASFRRPPIDVRGPPQSPPGHLTMTKPALLQLLYKASATISSAPWTRFRDELICLLPS